MPTEPTDPSRPVPPALLPGHKANFDTLQQAFGAGRCCLISSIRKSDREPVALICALNIDPKTGDRLFVPLAEMISTNPFEAYIDPSLPD